MTIPFVGAALGPPRDIVKYAETSAEQTASVTPARGHFAPGDIRRYGAVGDGATDCTLAISNAIAANEHVVIPDGVFLTTAKITISNANVGIRGGGRSSIVKASDASYNIFEVDADDVLFQSVAFHGAASDNTTGQYGIFSGDPAVARCKVIDCYFGGDSANARVNNGIIIGENCDSWQVRGCFFDQMMGTVSGTGYAVITGAQDFAIIAHNNCVGSSGRGRHAWYLSAGARYSQIISNESRDVNHSHITLNAGENQPHSAYNIVASNICNGGQTNASTGHIAIFGKATGNKIIGNTLIASGQNGILFIPRFNTSTDNACVDNAIINNIILDCGTIGIDIWGTTRTVLSGNTISNVSQNSSGVSAGIRLRASASGGQAVTDISVLNNVVTGTTHRTSLQFNATSPVPTGTVVKANNFAPGTLTVIEYGGITPEMEHPTGQETLAGANVTVTGLDEDNTTYQVLLTGNVEETFWVTGKTTSAFTINSSNAASTADVDWVIIRP